VQVSKLQFIGFWPLNSLYDLHTVTGAPLSVNFLRYKPGNRLRIPIEFVNAEQSQDIKRGSFVVSVQQYLDCVCDGEVPHSIALDLSGAQKGDIYRLSALGLPPQVRPAKNVAPDLVIAVVKTIRGAG
jgi:large subunit ribosomal protein L25